MQIIAKRTLKLFWLKHPAAKGPLTAWYALASKQDWSGPTDVRNLYGANVDFLGDNRIIFDIGGNKYRLIVHVAYRYKKILIKFIGTHAEYDKIDAETI